MTGKTVTNGSPLSRRLARDLMLQHLYPIPEDMTGVEKELQLRLGTTGTIAIACWQRLEFEIIETIEQALRESKRWT